MGIKRKKIKRNRMLLLLKKNDENFFEFVSLDLINLSFILKKSYKLNIFYN